METHTNQSTPKYIGFVYQVLIAIEQCFEAKKNQKIWIECYGDLYDGKIGTEVKHHIGKNNLTDNSPEFWNTLKNLVTEDISDIKQFILHTTSDIKPGSIFDGWNQLSKTKKYKRLKDHNPADTIAEFYNITIIKFPRKDLLPILDELTIKSSQVSVEAKWNELEENRFLNYIPEKFRQDALQWVYGYMHKRAIENYRLWRIKINDFDSACQIALNKFTQSEIPFPIISKDYLDSVEKEFRFVNEMKELEFKKSPIEKAVSDYLRASKSRLKLLSYEPTTISETLDDYDETVLDCVKSKKDYWLEVIDDTKTKTSTKFSKELYFDIINKQELIKIPNVNDTQKYYQNGRIHHSVNEKLFTWKLWIED